MTKEQNMSNKTQVLRGHKSPETAYLVDDYPYGFRLRCKIRYWMELKAGRGARLVSQTTNPKVAGEVWNKPKASTYSGGMPIMYLDGQGHLTWQIVSMYRGGPEQFDEARSQFDLNEVEQTAVGILERMYAKVNPNTWAEFQAKKTAGAA